MTWAELIRRLKAAGFVEVRTGKGSHRQLVHPKTGRIVTVAVHTKKEVGYRTRGQNSEGGRTMTQHYSIVVEREANGTFSAWVAGLPDVYAAADTVSAAKRGIRSALSAHLATLAERGQTAEPRADVAILRYDSPVRAGRPRLRFVGLGALLGLRTSARKTAAARRNGRKGGRPRKAPTG